MYEEKKQNLKEYHNAKAGECYVQNKKAMKEKSRERYKNLSQEKKTEYQRKKYQELVQYSKKND